MHGFHKHNVEQKKPDAKEYIQYGSPYRKFKKQAKLNYSV